MGWIKIVKKTHTRKKAVISLLEKGALQMKEKTRSIILLFFISLILVPSFIYGATAKQQNKDADLNWKKVLQRITVEPQEVHIPRGSKEQELRDMIEVKAYYKGIKKPKIVTDYKTNYETQKDKKGKQKITIEYTEDGCTKKDCVFVTFCKPMQSGESESNPPEQKPSNEEDINFPYISGYTDNTFKPDQAVSREEMATMLARLITKNRIPEEANQYTDLYKGRFSTDAVNYITKLGIMEPATSTSFNPAGPVSYSEFREIVNRLRPYIKNTNVALPSGNGDLTRAQAVVALNELFNVQCNTNISSSPFSDVTQTNPNYDDIICATQSRS